MGGEQGELLGAAGRDGGGGGADEEAVERVGGGTEVRPQHSPTADDPGQQPLKNIA